jgi:HK97 family phage major capsid protein
MAFDDILDRTDAGATIPREVAQVITGDIAQQSTVLALGTRVPTTTRDSRIPVLTQAPEAYWLTSETGEGSLKQTSKAKWSQEALVAEELAVIVPIPDNVIADSGFDLWGALRPLFARACARAIDLAVIWGVNKPASWTSPHLVASAVMAGQQVFEDINDGVKSLLQAAQLVGEAGYSPTGAVLRHGYQYKLATQRTDALTANPIGAASPFPQMIAGLPIRPDPVVWYDTDEHALVGDWRKVLIGMRQDLRVEFFNTGVLTDQAGNITVNLLQQDMTAARVTMRVGYHLAYTVTNTADTPSLADSPFAIVTSTSGYSYS